MISVSQKIASSQRKSSRKVFNVASVLLTISLMLILSGVAALGQNPPGTAPAPGTTAPNPCDQSNKGLEGTFKCLKHFYDKVTQSEGPHLVLGNVAPGSGLTPGFGYGKSSVGEKWRINLNASARVSVKKYWEVDSNVRLTKSSNTFSSSNANGPSGDLKIDIYAQVKDMPRLDFFGLVFSDANAPGIRRQPIFLHFVAFAGLHSSGQPESRKVDYKFLFHFFQDTQEHLYSFRRFDADLKHKFPFGKNEVRIRGRVSLSDTSSGQRVPFYLMETLGGSNVRGDDTLRGFRDYRFRDRDLALLQLEYMRTVYGPINLIAFYDTGKVAPNFSSFDAGRLRHTYGFGMVVVPRRGENVLIRFYVALGSGEGAHTYVGSGDLLGGRADRLLR